MRTDKEIEDDLQIKFCADCGVACVTWFTTALDQTPRCEKCAVNNYMAKCPGGCIVLYPNKNPA